MSYGIPAMRKCVRCGVRRPPEDFYEAPKRPCRICNRGAMQARYAKRAAILDKIKMDSGCVDCGYRENSQALEFDHLPQFEKLHRVSAFRVSGSEEQMYAEIAKCEVVCANCHRVRTMSRPYQSRKLPTPKGGTVVYGPLTDEPGLFELPPAM